MDVIGQVWASLGDAILKADPGLKAYVVRVGLGLAATLLLATPFVRSPENDDEPRLLRQATVAALGLLATLLMPMEWLDATSPRLQVVAVAAGVFAALSLPPAVVANLVRTYGRQLLARRTLYGAIALGFLVQLAIGAGG